MFLYHVLLYILVNWVCVSCVEIFIHQIDVYLCVEARCWEITVISVCEDLTQGDYSNICAVWGVYVVVCYCSFCRKRYRFMEKYMAP